MFCCPGSDFWTSIAFVFWLPFGFPHNMMTYDAYTDKAKEDM